MNYNVRYSQCYIVRRADMLTEWLKAKIPIWLSPPDPSTNHANACKPRLDGTATWFTGGTTFEEWKKNGSLLWIRGNRKLLPPRAFHAC
jgi:hypothetical protein